MSVGRMRRPRLYLTIQLCGMIAQQGPPAHLTNRGGFGELGFLPGLLGIAHGIAHDVANGIADILGTTGSVRNTGTKVKGLRDWRHSAVSRARTQRPIP